MKGEYNYLVYIDSFQKARFSKGQNIEYPDTQLKVFHSGLIILSIILQNMIYCSKEDLYMEKKTILVTLE